MPRVYAITLVAVVFGGGCSDDSARCPPGFVAAGSDCRFEDAGQDGAGDAGNDAYVRDVSLRDRGIDHGNDVFIDLGSDTPDAPLPTEVCNGMDDDGDGNTDEGFPVNTYFEDFDADSYGSSAECRACDITVCTGAHVSMSGDCDDHDAEVNPSATEICNGVDDDCDGMRDEALTTRYFRDQDHDEFGDPEGPVDACSLPSGYVTNDTDCAPREDLAYPSMGRVFQTRPMTNPPATGLRFDYDCSGVEESEFPALPQGRCRSDGMSGDFWDAPFPPECGETGTFYRCECDGFGCTFNSARTETARCR